MKRIEWIDLAKGMSIILVVYGHAGLASVPYLGDWAAAFAMPFFFLVSGLLFSSDRYPTFSAFVSKRWQTLIRPFFIFSGICLLAYWYLYPDDIAVRIGTIVRKGWGGLALWFIPVLTCTEILFYFIRKYAKRQRTVALWLIASAALGWISYVLALPDNYNLWFVSTAILFYGGGNLASGRIGTLFASASVRKQAGISFAALFLSGTYLVNAPKP